MTASAARVAAFFDMDHTLLCVETGMSWVRFLRGRGELPAQMVAKAVYWSTLYKLALLDMETVFTRLVEDLRGDAEADMIAKCEIWYRRHVEPEIAPAARVAVEHHRAAGHLVVLATGSTQYAARPVARGVGIEHVLSSELEVVGGTFTGRARALCFGHHKVSPRRAVGGRPRRGPGAQLLLLGQLQRPADARARRDRRRGQPRHPALPLARRRGWPVQRWM